MFEKFLIKNKNQEYNQDGLNYEKFNNNHEVKFNNPKILLVDLDNTINEELVAKGFNVQSGTFGSPYITKSGQRCQLNGHLPYLSEKDLVIVKQETKKIRLEDYMLSEENYELREANKTILVTPRGQNYFDGRPLFSFGNYYNFERIIEKGKIIVVFADESYMEQYTKMELRNGDYYDEKQMNVSSYQWVPTRISINNGSGREFTINKKSGIKEMAEAIIKGCENEISYKCTFNIINDNDTVVLLENNFEEAIGYIQKNGEGFLIVLPSFKDYLKPIQNLIHEVLPQLKPNLFPDFVKNIWVDDDEYVFPEVKKLKLEKEILLKEYDSKFKEIEEKINKSKENNKFLTNIIISEGHSEFLVKNIQETLEYIGYKDVIDVDNIVTGNKQEDLRILDNKRFTSIEIKGHKGMATEDDTQAILKYISRNMRAEGRTDIHGILIVNHQRMLPPLERNTTGFSSQQIEDAHRDMYTLVTTWELYQAVRLLQENIITFEDIDKSLHTPGLFNAIPLTYKFLGDIQKIYSKNKENNIACFYLVADAIRKGDKLLIKDGNNYFEEIVGEMQIESRNVEYAEKGAKLAIVISKIISKNAKVYVKTQNF